MRSRPRYLGWGVFLVCLGIVPLGVQLGLIQAREAASLLRLWPLILVGKGLSLVLSLSRYRDVGRVLSGGVSGLVLGVFFAAGFGSAAFFCSGDQAQAAPLSQTGSFGPSAQVGLELTCGKVSVTRSADASWTVRTDAAGSAPSITADNGSLVVRSNAAANVTPLGASSNELWQIDLPAQTAVSAGVTLTAAVGDIRLGPGNLGNVSTTLNGARADLDLRDVAGADYMTATLNASSGRLFLPASPIRAGLTLNVSSLTVCAPPAADLRISYSNVLGSDNFAAAGLHGGGESWSTASGATAASELHITSNLSSVTIDRSGECQ